MSQHACSDPPHPCAVAKQRGIKFVEVIEPTMRGGGPDVLLSSMSITIKGARPVLAAAADASGAVSVEGCVRAGSPWLSRVGTYDLSLAVEGPLLLYANTDQPGIIGRVGTLLAAHQINIAFMAVARSGPRERALAALGVDMRPPEAALAELAKVPAITEVAYIEM